jgi:hypothetical protein
MSTYGGNSEVIAQKGDVILQLGKEGVGEGVRNVLVASVALGLASPVFSTMFDGRFSEGQNLSPASPRTVPLPDDDPDSMIMICKITHMQTSQLTMKPSAIVLSQLALLCNKYDCVVAVRPWAIIWIAALLETPTTPDFEKLVLSTHLLDLPNEFSRVSQSLIRDQPAMFSIANAMDGHEFLPWNVYQCILLGQMTHRRDISKAFGSIVTGTEQCAVARQAIGLFLQRLKRGNIWPYSDHSVPTIKSELKAVNESVFSTNSISCLKSRGPSCPCKAPSCLKSTLLIELDKIYDAVNGLCLECVRHKALGHSKPPCANSHPTTGAMIHL